MSSRLLRTLDALAPNVRDAFLRAVQDVKSEAQLALIARHLESGQIEMALEALNLRPEFFAPLQDALRAAYLQGGAEALADLPRLPDPFPAGAWWRALMGGTRARNNG